MKVLVVGGAGRVGGIIRPALEAQHTCSFYDLKPAPGAADRSVIADVNDGEAVRKAVQGMDAVVYLAMGIKPGTRQDVSDPGIGFAVNACGWYRFLDAGLACGVRRFVYASSLSVYRSLHGCPGVDESQPADSWTPYGLTKRVGEFLCAAAVQKQPDARIVALRLMQPTSDAEWAVLTCKYPHTKNWCPLAPNDTRRLFLAALACDKPGVHIVQTTGDTGGDYYPFAKAQATLGWRPEGN